MAICDPCVVAGAANKRLNDANNYPGTADAKAVARLHSSCPGKSSCDCQHFVGQAIQKEYR